MLAKLQHILHLLWNPDTSVISERLRHEGELALLVTVYRNTGRMDLCKARVGEECSLLVTLDCSGTVAVHCVGGKEICIAITAGCDHDCMGAESLKFSGHKISCYDTLCLTVDDDKVKHLMSRIACDGTCGNLSVE